MDRLKIVETDLAVLRNEWLGRFNYAFGGVLRPGDERQIQAEVTFIGHAQERMVFDEYFNQAFLQGAIANALDAYGERVATPRLQGAKATCYMRFYVQGELAFDVEIPKNTRVSADSKVYFATEQTDYIRRGETSVLVRATAATIGESANDYQTGDINLLIDNIAFVSAVSNIAPPTGGADTESDDAYRERIRFAYAKTTTAGSEESYIYWTKTASALVGDVVVQSPLPGEVLVSFLLADNTAPNKQMLKLVSGVLNAKSVRPMTDLVTVQAPTQVAFSLDVKAYIDDLLFAANLQAVKDAITAYIAWQTSKIGLAITPDMLTKMALDAGAKVVDIAQPPGFTPVGKSAIATLQGMPAIAVLPLSQRGD